MGDLLKGLEEYFKNTPQEKIKSDWDSLKEYDKTGPTIKEFLETCKYWNMIDKIKNLYNENQPDSLFRAKDLNDNWVFGELITLNGDSYLYVESDEKDILSNLIKIKKETICSFAKYYDLNKNPLFEYDIIKDEENNLFYIFWHKEQASWYIRELYRELEDTFLIKCGCTSLGNGYRSTENKLIGNLFDSKDLLLGKSSFLSDDYRIKDKLSTYFGINEFNNLIK